MEAVAGHAISLVEMTVRIRVKVRAKTDVLVLVDTS